MGKWLSLVIGVGALCAVAAQAQGAMTENEAIDKAGAQRMLSQRILKAYCELGLSEAYSEPQTQLMQAVDKFDAHLAQLDGFVTATEMKQALAEVRGVWPAYKELALKPPSKEGAKALLEMNNKLLPLTHNVVVRMEEGYGTSAGKWVNLAGRQRMLSQRIAMLYLLRIWGVAGEAEIAAADQAMNEYQTALDTLKTYSRNTKETTELIARMESQFSMLKKARAETGGNLSFLIATGSERMLEYAHKLTGLYAAMDQQK